MAKPKGATSTTAKKGMTVSKRTSIGSGMPRNRHKRRNWKPYNAQGRV